MLLHADGFDWIPTAADDALLADRYTLVGSEVTIDDSATNVILGNGLTGGSGSETDNRLTLTIVGVNTIIHGFHVNLSSFSDRKLLDWVDGSLRITSTGKIQVYNGGSLVTESAAGVLSSGANDWIEFKIKFDSDPDVGFVVVGVNDVPVIRTFAATADSAITPNTWRLIASHQTIFDDWVIKDTSGAYNNSFGGEAFVLAGQVQTRSTTLDGDTTEPHNHGASTLFYSWDNEDTDSEFNNAHLSESPPDDDTTYVVEPATVDLGDVHRVDPVDLNALINVDSPIVAVNILYRAKLTSAGSESFLPILFHPNFDPGPDYVIDNTADSAEVYEAASVAVTTTGYKYHTVIYPQAITDAAPVTADWTEDLYASTEYGYRSMA